MAKTPTAFKTETQLGITATVLTTVPSTSASIHLIRNVTFFNQSTTLTETVTVYRYSTAPATTNVIIVKDIPPQKTWNCVELQGKVISPGLTLAALTTTAATVNADCDGIIST